MYQPLSHDCLMHCYLQAKKLRLDEDFIKLLFKEIERRELNVGAEVDFI